MKAQCVIETAQVLSMQEHLQLKVINSDARHMNICTVYEYVYVVWSLIIVNRAIVNDDNNKANYVA